MYKVLVKENSSVVFMFFYFDKLYWLVGISVLFVGNFVVVVIMESKLICDDSDIMLYYI